MRHLFRPTLTLKKTGQPVVDADAATPRGLRKTPNGYVRVVIKRAGHRNSVQLVKRSNVVYSDSPLSRMPAAHFGAKLVQRGVQ